MPEIKQYSESVYVIKRLLSTSECEELIQKSESIGYDDAPLTTRSGPVMDKSIRNNHRVILDSVELSEELWEITSPYAKARWKHRDVRGLNERLRFYRYDSGEQFDWHYDGHYERTSGERSQFTLMFYLNDRFEGGATEFSDFTVTPAQGDALFFWHHQIHRGAPVIGGRKYVLRTDVMYVP